MPAVNKVIVTNVSGLKVKYADKYAAVAAAISRLIQADLGRGLRTILIALDSPSDMKRVNGTARLEFHGRKRRQKGDRCDLHALPARLSAVLGAPDVIPHVRLTNPMSGTRDDDGDPDVPSDVPYASDHPWSRRPQAFVGPTRVVGRLPDQTGVQNPAYLVKLLTAAANYSPRNRSTYSGHFAITAKVWTKSTTESVGHLFGPGAAVLTAPPHGPNWSNGQLAPRLHFINCHGDTVSPKSLRGVSERPLRRRPQRRASADSRDERIGHRRGMLLWRRVIRSRTSGRPGGNCEHVSRRRRLRLLRQHQHRVRTIRGPGSGRPHLRVLIESVLKGASLGRATLEARQRFVAQYLTRRSVRPEDGRAVPAPWGPLAPARRGYAPCRCANACSEAG